MRFCRLIRQGCGFFIGAVLVLLCATRADAAMILLSTAATHGADPALLDASIEFEVTGNALTITVTNTTEELHPYHINQILFNASSDVTSVQETSMPTGWSLATHRNANAFGHFEYMIHGGAGANSQALLPGDSAMFVLTFQGSNVTAEDFLSEFSDGARPMLVAAKFLNGPGNAGPYGGTDQAPPIPEPGCLALLMGAIAVAYRRRRT